MHDVILMREPFAEDDDERMKIIIFCAVSLSSHHICSDSYVLFVPV